MTRGAGRVGTYVGRGSQPLAEDPTSTGLPHHHSPVTSSPITSPHTCSTPVFGSPSMAAATSSSLDGGSFIVSRQGRYPIQVISHKLHPSEPVARRITKIFKEKMDPSGHDWKSLTPEVKEFYWHEFQKHFVWGEETEEIVKALFLTKCAEIYKSLMNSFRNKGKPPYVPQSVWETWLPHWETPEFKAKSMQFSKNRLSETGGEGNGPSRHTGGSISHREHARRMEIRLQRPPLPHELLEATHIRKKDKQFVDQKSKNTYEAILSRVAMASQTPEGLIDPLPDDISQMYLEEVGGVKKQRVYGLGSQASTFFTLSIGSSSSVTSRAPSQDDIDARVQEVERRVQEMEVRVQERCSEEFEQRVQDEVQQRVQDEVQQRVQTEVQQQLELRLDEILQTRLAHMLGNVSETQTSSRHL